MSQSKSKIALPASDERDVWIPDPEFIKEFGISPMTASRYDADPELAKLGWPPPMRIKDRKFRSRRMVEAFKQNMLRIAMEQRRKLFAVACGANNHEVA